MTIARIDLPDPTYQRAWSVANAAERATLLASGDPRRGDIIEQLDTGIYYAVVKSSIVQQISGLAAIPINLATQVTGTLGDGSLSSNVPLKNGTNAFTGANSFATSPLDLLVGQIKFPATQNPSANANTLDDYKEGVWTPVDSSGAGLAVFAYFADYVKIGKVVNISVGLAYPTTADATKVVVGGLPFNNGVADGSLSAGFTNSGLTILYSVRPSSSTIEFFTTAGANIINSQASGKVFVAAGFYFV